MKGREEEEGEGVQQTRGMEERRKRGRKYSSNKGWNRGGVQREYSGKEGWKRGGRGI
jgi:hypothetical protein